MSFLDDFEILPLIHVVDITCTVDGESFFTFTKNTQIGDAGTSRHITNNDTVMYNITGIDELLEGSSGNMKVTKK